MTLSYDCVIQNFEVGNIVVGATKLVVEPIYMGGRVFQITRMTEEYCKVRRLSMNQCIWSSLLPEKGILLSLTSVDC